MLFSFGNPTTAKVRLGEIFLLEQDVAKHNMRAATVVRDTFATQSVKHAMAPPGSDFSPMLDALDEYLPVLVALVEQIHKTYNKNMSEALGKVRSPKLHWICSLPVNSIPLDDMDDECERGSRVAAVRG